jgi:hypothetical protein
MKFQISLLVALVALLVSGCPLGPLSGGRLSGEVQPAPVFDWSFVNEEETCQLETNPDDPHSVNTWCLGQGRYLYIPTSMILGPKNPSEREWVQNVQTDSQVRIRVDGVVYELDAVRVSDDGERTTVIVALEEKYELDPADRDPEREIWLFRMQAR